MTAVDPFVSRQEGIMLAVYARGIQFDGIASEVSRVCEMKSTLFKSEILDKSQGTADKFVNGVMNASQAKVVILHALDIYSEDR